MLLSSYCYHYRQPDDDADAILGLIRSISSMCITCAIAVM